jgi:flavin reductase (DIM6/NTAB) family NADH-FMN oxidoreductase RutF
VKRPLDPKMLYFGTPVVLVGSLNTDGTTNLAPMSSAWWLGRTAMLGLAATSQTVRNLERRPDCVLSLADAALVDAVDRLALLTGRPDVPAYKVARGYRYEPDKYAAAGLTPSPGAPAGVAESRIELRGRVRAMHEVGDAGSGLRALEVAILDIRVDEDLLMPHHPTYIDPLRWDPLIMKFTEYFAGGEVTRPSSLARGWGMPPLAAARPRAHGEDRAAVRRPAARERAVAPPRR